MIYRKIPWTRQPQTPVQINQGLVQALGIKHFWSAVPMSSNLWRDSVGEAHVTSTANVTAAGGASVNDRGKVWRSEYNIAAPYGALIASARVTPFIGQAAISSLVIFKLTSAMAGTSHESSFWRKSGTAGTTGIGLSFFSNAGTKKLRPLIATSGVTGWGVSHDVVVSDLVVDAWYAVAFSYTSGKRLTYFGTPENLTLRNTITAITGTISGSATDSANMYIGGLEAAGATVVSAGVEILAIALSNTVILEEQFKELSKNIWSVFAPQQRNIFVSAAGDSITADASITQASNTAAGDATLTVVADASITTSGDTTTSASVLELLADASITQAGNTASADSALSLTANASITQADNSVTSDGAITLLADVSITQAGDATTSAAALTVIVDASITQAGDTLASAAALTAETITADASITQDGNTTTANSTLIIAVDASITQASDTATANSVITIVADASITQDGDSLTSAAALASDTITADASITQDGNTSSADGVIAIAADASVTQADNTSSSIGVLTIIADCFITQSGDTLTSAASIGGTALLPSADRMRMVAYDTRIRTVEYDTRIRRI